MPRKKTSSHRPAASPSFDLMLVRRPGAPARPGRERLVELFARAWSLLPPGRRPELAGQTRIAVDVLMVDDSEIEQLNAAHLKERGPTDVLSFPMGETDFERSAYHLGEIVVSFDTARREAAARDIPLETELSRYCVHGFLHLLGYEDATTTQREEMFALQEKALGT
jgi:probable rRNA maturation factor